MKRAEAIFVLHGNLERQSKLLSLLGDDVYVVVWPGVDHNKVRQSLAGFDDTRHTILEIGSPARLIDGRNNIIDYCAENNIERFWMLDDDVTFRLGGPSQEFKDEVFHDGKYFIKNIHFDDDVGLGGMTMSGVMFNNHINAPEFGNRFIWAAIFIDLRLNNIRYTVPGYDDIDMQLECVKNGIRTQTTNWIGQTKPNWLTKKSLNSQIDKINYNNWLVYRKWGDSTQIDVFYDKMQNKYYRIHIRWPYKLRDTFKYQTDTLENFVASIDKEYNEHPENFHVCGLPHMKKDVPVKSKKEKSKREKVEVSPKIIDENDGIPEIYWNKDKEWKDQYREMFKKKKKK